MSDVAAVRYLLANNVALTAVVPAANIMAGLVPQGTALPAIAIAHVSTVRKHFVAATSREYCTSRVQVTVMANTYPTQKSVLALVRAALPRSTGATVGSVKVDNILDDFEGPDFRDDQAEPPIYMGSHDFIVTFNE